MLEGAARYQEASYSKEHRTRMNEGTAVLAHRNRVQKTDVVTILKGTLLDGEPSISYILCIMGLYLV
jgi:hypothetical protein